MYPLSFPNYYPFLTIMLNQLSRIAPCIFVLESDDDVRPTLKYNLQHWGYDVVMVIDEEDAVQRTQEGREHFDLILLNQCGQLIEALIAIGQQIRQSADWNRQTPIVILAEDYGADLEGQDTQVGDNEYVIYLEDGQQLKNILQRLCPVP